MSIAQTSGIHPAPPCPHIPPLFAQTQLALHSKAPVAASLHTLSLHTLQWDPYQTSLPLGSHPLRGASLALSQMSLPSPTFRSSCLLNSECNCWPAHSRPLEELVRESSPWSLFPWSPTSLGSTLTFEPIILGQERLSCLSQCPPDPCFCRSSQALQFPSLPRLRPPHPVDGKLSLELRVQVFGPSPYSLGNVSNQQCRPVRGGQRGRLCSESPAHFSDSSVSSFPLWPPWKWATAVLPNSWAWRLGRWECCLWDGVLEKTQGRRERPGLRGGCAALEAPFTHGWRHGACGWTKGSEWWGALGFGLSVSPPTGATAALNMKEVSQRNVEKKKSEGEEESVSGQHGVRDRMALVTNGYFIKSEQSTSFKSLFSRLQGDCLCLKWDSRVNRYERE